MSLDLQAIGKHFLPQGTWLSAVPYGQGHIHDTFLAAYDLGGEVRRLIHQRLNTTVFRDTSALMRNIARVSRHLQIQRANQGPQPGLREPLRLIPTAEGEPCYTSLRGEIWRTFAYVPETTCFEVAVRPAQAQEVGRAFGAFQRLLGNLEPPRLAEVIPAFHHTPARLQALRQALGHDSLRRAGEAADEIDYALGHAEMAGRLVELEQGGEIPERVVHNDTKINNVLFDRAGTEAVCVTDLDTVMPGLALYDFGDMVRTCTCHAAEDETDLERMTIDAEMFEALTRGYTDQMGALLTAAEKENLAFSGWLITYEVAVRFLTDFLLGDTYFKIHRPRHNLDRARAQFALARNLESRLTELQAITDKLLGRIQPRMDANGNRRKSL